MTRPARLVLITVVMALIGVTALFLIARQFEKKSRATRSVMDLPVETQSRQIPLPPAEAAGEAAGSTAGAEEPPSGATGGSAGLTEEQKESLRKVEVFAQVREGLMEVLNSNHKFRESFLQELTGDISKRDRIPMYNYELAKMRVARHEPLTEGGMSEEEYRMIRGQYRAWLSGEGEVDPAWRWAFENSPEEVMRKADMGKYDPTDF